MASQTLTLGKKTSILIEFACNSAADPGGFPAMMLNKCRSSHAYPLLFIWKKSVNEGIMPSSWKLGNIIPIHMGKSRAIIKNDCPVALTSLLVKTFEKIVCKQLVRYFDEHDMFNDSRHGFWSSWSCLSQLLAHVDQITWLLEEGKSVDVVYLDFTKAFDKEVIGVRLRKLKSLGIHGNLANSCWSPSVVVFSVFLWTEGNLSPRQYYQGYRRDNSEGPSSFLFSSEILTKTLWPLLCLGLLMILRLGM